ncbi:hypothetical protein LCGC14_0445850 [marine sediment metagenome]|uniref:Uncharacterized protein n=1 Tax=marine sediment metagenome TaxID=412755 RepID=A0A0F9VT57_9ZZZZ
MTAAAKQPAIELPSLTVEETALIERIRRGTTSLVAIREYLTFLTRRRRVIDALAKETCPEWPAVKGAGR